MKQVADCLLDIGAVTLSPKDPYTWASGIKAPIYCDNRLLMSHPQEWEIVIESLISLIHDKYPQVDYIMGTATAGIPHGALIAYRLKLPMGFVRGKAKDHGKGKRIEGEIVKGANCLVIEDLFSTGGSSIEAAKACVEEGFNVLGILSIFTYDLKKGGENFAKSGFNHQSATNLEELLGVAIERKDITEEEGREILAWKDQLE